MRRHPRMVSCLLLASAAATAAPDTRYYFGADLSYVNELEDCGAAYFFQGKKRDPFELIHERGANLARVRLWNDARWTRYSNLAGVKKTIERSQGAGMAVLLEPFRATQFDTAWEPYFHDEALIGLSAYYKNVSSYIGWRQEPQTFGGITYAVAVPVNGNGGSVSGAEVAFQTPFFFWPARENCGV